MLDLSTEELPEEYFEEKPTEETPAEEAPAEEPAPQKKAPPKKKASSPKKRKKKKSRKKKSRGWLVALITVFVLLLAAGGAAVWAGLQVSKVDTVYPGVTAAGIDLSGMTLEEAKEALLTIGHERYDGYAVTANLPLDNTLTITGEEAGIQYSMDQLAADAFGYGRSDGFLGALIAYGQARYLGRNHFQSEAGLEVSMDEAAVRAIIAEAAVDIDAQLLESGIEITDTEIRVQKGASGLTLDEEQVFAGFRDAILSGDREGFTYESVPEPDQEYDFQALHDEMYSEMVSARIVYAPEYAAEYAAPDETNTPVGIVNYANGNKGAAPVNSEGTEIVAIAPALTDPQPGDEELDFQGQPFLVTQSSVGVDFDVAEAERQWAAAGYGDTVTVPLTVTQPEHSTEEINGMLFADNLSKNYTMVRLWNRDYCEEVRTSLSGSSKNRISNVKKACEILDGMMLMPGEIFSYNDTIGQRTEEAGWLPAPAYADGEVHQQPGGGICQVSSTLYNAAAYSNLKIVERECHQFQVGYLPWGMDATVSWGWPDFKFQNTQPFPIRIHAWVDDAANECCIQIQGTDVDHIYVIMRFNNWKLFDQTDTYHDASGNPLAVGMAAATWRLLYHDGDDWATGKPFSEEYEYYSSYHYHTEDIEAKNVPLASPPAEEGGET